MHFDKEFKVFHPFTGLMLRSHFSKLVSKKINKKRKIIKQNGFRRQKSRPFPHAPHYYHFFSSSIDWLFEFCVKCFKTRFPIK